MRTMAKGLIRGAILSAMAVGVTGAHYGFAADQPKGPVMVASKSGPAADSQPAGQVALPAAASAPQQAAAAAPAAPKIQRQAFGEWGVECFDPKVNGLNCQMVQRLIAKDTKQLVLSVSIAYSPAAKKHIMQIELPLNFMLKPGVEIAIGDSKTVAQVDRCSNQGCFIEGVAGDDLVAALNRGDKADIKFLANPEKRLVVPFSLQGFPAAYDSMKAKNSAS